MRVVCQLAQAARGGGGQTGSGGTTTTAVRFVLAGKGGGVSPSVLAGGIWEALITTAAGLMIGIPAYLGYRYLQTRVDHLVVEMEEESLALAELLEERSTPTPPAAGSAAGSTAGSTAG